MIGYLSRPPVPAGHNRPGLAQGWASFVRMVARLLATAASTADSLKFLNPISNILCVLMAPLLLEHSQAGMSQ